MRQVRETRAVTSAPATRH